MTARTPAILSLPLIAALALGSYLFASQRLYRLGFPLDDAWIHQTYARNLAQHGQWAFLPGQPSAGSTAPLWSALLVPGHAAGLGPYLWTFLLGWLTLSALALCGLLAFGRLVPDRPAWALAAGAFLALEWHLVWSAASGMETTLFALLVLACFACLAALSPGSTQPERPEFVSHARRDWGWLGLGALIATSAWVRPDGLTLLAPAGLVILFSATNWRRRVGAAALLLLGFAVVIGLYFWFNQAVAGAWLPNTYFAKQAEYAALRQIPFWRRFLGQAGLPLVGAGLLLLPGFLIALYQALRHRWWIALAACAWLGGYLALYAWRLPVTYQHGRYMIPAMPVYFVLGLAGVAAVVQVDARQAVRRLGSRIWVVSTAIVLLSFFGLGARAYARDVAVIESEMVATAAWVAVNTERDALVAAHDIGALGYFGERDLLDLAGLVSPQVIAFIREEPALEAYLDARGAEYLVTFPGWYPRLAQRGDLIYTTGGPFSPAQGGENMAVYRWDAGGRAGAPQE